MSLSQVISTSTTVSTVEWTRVGIGAFVDCAGAKGRTLTCHEERLIVEFTKAPSPLNSLTYRAGTWF